MLHSAHGQARRDYREHRKQSTPSRQGPWQLLTMIPGKTTNSTQLETCWKITTSILLSLPSSHQKNCRTVKAGHFRFFISAGGISRPLHMLSPHLWCSSSGSWWGSNPLLCDWSVLKWLLLSETLLWLYLKLKPHCTTTLTLYFALPCSVFS